MCCISSDSVVFLQLEPAGLNSLLKVELNLSQGFTKDGEAKPPALLCCVLQALAIQGDLQLKIKLFSKNKLSSLFLSFYLIFDNIFWQF